VREREREKERDGLTERERVKKRLQNWKSRIESEETEVEA
jgi:hypothetical protein